MILHDQGYVEMQRAICFRFEWNQSVTQILRGPHGLVYLHLRVKKLSSSRSTLTFLLLED